MAHKCCVSGCSNNKAANVQKQHSGLTFHAFPVKQKLRKRWLKAIGRPGWKPQESSVICSIHFTDDQFHGRPNNTGRKLKKCAYPVQYLALSSQESKLTDTATIEPKQQDKSNESPSDNKIDKSYLQDSVLISSEHNTMFEASGLEVCRFCLVSDVKMYNLRGERLAICFNSILGVSKEECLPQLVCYECAAQLFKSYALIQRSNIARDTLLSVFYENGFVNKQLVNKINRKKLQLKSSLTYNKVVPKTIVELHYDDDLNKYIFNSTFQENIKKENDVVDEDNGHFEEVSTNNEISIPSYNINEMINDYKMDSEFDNDQYNMVVVGDDVKDSSFEGVSDDGSGVHNDDDDDDDLPLAATAKLEISKNRDKRIKGTKPKKSLKRSKDVTTEEADMQEYCNIVTLTLEEQIAERQKLKETEAYRDALYKCELCYKTYIHPDAYNAHLEHHSPSAGSAECPVCKFRFKSEALAASHAQRVHAKKYYCKSCPKAYSVLRMAKVHQKRHEGYVYKCNLCDFTTLINSSYRKHVTSRHGGRHAGLGGAALPSRRGLDAHARGTHGQAAASDTSFHCSQCNIQFPSEGEWRQHQCTYEKSEHSLVNGQSLPANERHWCERCNEQFANVRELHKHERAAHRKRRAGSAWALPGDRYPIDCEHCGETVNNRGEHYLHVRKVHPKEREKYQPVILAVCDTCGKGFQNSTKLHLHELRHKGAGSVRCPHCPRLFYDKYQLGRHIGVHSDERPFACTLCDKSFKQRSNLDRHAKVHSGTTAYECTMCGKRFRYSSSRNLHVKTVHYKMPQPPRKKRAKTIRAPPYENCV